jgi:hypothetical protein
VIYSSVVDVDVSRGDDADRLHAILARFSHDPDDAALWPAARELADRFTLDQLCAMAAPRAAEVRRLFDRILGRATRCFERQILTGAQSPKRRVARAGTID